MTNYPENTSNVLKLEKLKEMLPIYASHDNPHSKTAITIGKAIKSSGETIPVRLDDIGMKMHWDLVGMSGTGKTSLLTRL